MKLIVLYLKLKSRPVYKDHTVHENALIMPSKSEKVKNLQMIKRNKLFSTGPQLSSQGINHLVSVQESIVLANPL